MPNGTPMSGGLSHLDRGIPRIPVELSNAYLDAFCAADMDTVAALLLEGVAIELPLSLNGEDVSMFSFEVKAAAIEYLSPIIANLRQVNFDQRQVFAADHWKTGFVEVKGDLIQWGAGAIYWNTYCLEVTVQGDAVSRVSEYTNPIA